MCLVIFRIFTLPWCQVILRHQPTQTRDAGVGVHQSDSAARVIAAPDLQDLAVDGVRQTVELRNYQQSAAQLHQTRICVQHMDP